MISHPLSPALGGNPEGIVRGLSVGEMRALSPLPKNSQELIDKEVSKVGMDRLSIVGDAIAAGMVYNLPDPLSVTYVTWSRSGKSGFAIRTMEPTARGENQLPDMKDASIPVYLTMDDFELGLRTIRAAERVGMPLDTSMVADSALRVNEAIEDAAINGWTDDANNLVNFNNFQAPGLLNAPYVNNYQYAGGTALDASGKTGEQILADLKAMILIEQGNRFWGPYNWYVPGSYSLKFGDDYKALGTTTIQERITAAGLGVTVRIADMLPANRTILMEMSSRVFDVIIGQKPAVLSWQASNNPLSPRRFVTLAVMIPRVKYNIDNKSGIVVSDTVAH